MKFILNFILAFCVGFFLGGIAGSFLEGVIDSPVIGKSAMIGASVMVGLNFLLNVLQYLTGILPAGSYFVTVCGAISADFAFDCDNPLQGGVADRAYIINWDDWKAATITRDATNPMLITDIVLAGAATAFFIDGRNNSNAPTFSLVKQTFANVFDHTFNFKIFDLSPETKAQLQAAKDGKFVVVYENNFRGTTGNSAFEVLGEGAGMEVTVLTRDPNSTDTQGAYDVTFASNANIKESQLPKTFFDTSYATSKAALEALLT